MQNVTRTSDMVEVVKCKNCTHCYYATNRSPDEQCWVCDKHGIDVTEDWYCADGERRDENDVSQV